MRPRRERRGGGQQARRARKITRRTSIVIMHRIVLRRSGARGVVRRDRMLSSDGVMQVGRRRRASHDTIVNSRDQRRPQHDGVTALTTVPRHVRNASVETTACPRTALPISHDDESPIHTPAPPPRATPARFVNSINPAAPHADGSLDRRPTPRTADPWGGLTIWWHDRTLERAAAR